MKGTMMEAEIACLPSTEEDGLYKSQLLWTTQQHYYEFAARLVEKTYAEGCGYWIGLDNRKQLEKWEDRYLAGCF